MLFNEQIYLRNMQKHCAGFSLFNNFLGQKVKGWNLDIHVLYLEIFLKHVSQLWPWQTRWKLKVKQLEREVDRHKHGANQLMQRNEQLVKEVEGHRQNLHHTGIQMENMKRELGDALVSIF